MQTDKRDECTLAECRMQTYIMQMAKCRLEKELADCRLAEVNVHGAEIWISLRYLTSIFNHLWEENKLAIIYNLFLYNYRLLVSLVPTLISNIISESFGLPLKKVFIINFSRHKIIKKITLNIKKNVRNKNTFLSFCLTLFILLQQLLNV